MAMDDKGSTESAEFDEPFEVRGSAVEATNLEPEDRPRLADTHTAHEIFESCASRGAARRDSQVGIDGHDPRRVPPETPRLLRQCILARRRLGMLADLCESRLTDVDDREPLQVPAGDRARTAHRVS